MQSKFEEVISGFLEKRIGTSNEFLTADLALHLKANLIALYANEALKLAGVGNARVVNHNLENRSDKIHWIDQHSNDVYEHDFFVLMDAFVLYLNSTCFAGIKSYEFHYALFEQGAFYKKHLDQFKTDDSRAFSMIMHLNQGWTAFDGGELKVYQAAGIELISPENQKCVFFKSNELVHEVLLTNVSRMSITGWLKTSL